jgi:hypothetical protein
MAAPFITSRVTGYTSGARGACRIPAGEPGDLLLWVYTFSDFALPSELPPGWTKLAESRSFSTSFDLSPTHGIAYRVADGTEGKGPDGSVHPYVDLKNFNGVAGTNSIMHRIRGAEHPSISPPTVSAVARNTGSGSTTPNAAAPAAGASGDYLVITTVGANGVVLPTSAPTNYGVPVLTLTDLSVTGTTTLSSLTVNSVTGGFTENMVGSALRITAGTNFVPGFYRITGFINTNSIIVANFPTPAGGTSHVSASGGSGSVGSLLVANLSPITTMTADRQILGGTTDDPGDWTLATSTRWIAYTVMIPAATAGAITPTFTSIKPAYRVPYVGGGVAHANFDAEVMKHKPRGYWRLNEPAGGPPQDSSGNGHHGQGTYGAVSDPTKDGRIEFGVPGLLANGDTDTAARMVWPGPAPAPNGAIIAIPSNAQRYVGLEFPRAFTALCFIRIDAALSGEYLMASAGVSSGMMYSMQISANGLLRMEQRNAAATLSTRFSAAPVIALGETAMLTVTREPNGLTPHMFKNDTEVAVAGGDHSVLPAPTSFAAGASSDDWGPTLANRAFITLHPRDTGAGQDAVGDEVVVWNYQLAPSSIQALWEVATAGTPPPPVVTVTSVAPGSGLRGEAGLSLAVTGTGFVSGATSFFSGTGITVNSTTFNSATSLTLNVTIAVGATLGSRSLTVINPDTSEDTLDPAFTVANRAITSVTPATGAQGSGPLALSILGTGFNSGVVVSFSGSGITVNSTIRNSSTSLTVTVTIASDAPIGARTITATNPDTTTAVGTAAFTVTAFVPVPGGAAGGQIRTGQAKVLSSNLRRVEFSSAMTLEDAARLESGQAFKFQGETLLFFTVASVISVVPPVVIELVSNYNGSKPLDVFANYQVWTDFTPSLGLFELGPGDVDIRDAFTQNMRILDAVLGP